MRACSAAGAIRWTLVGTAVAALAVSAACSGAMQAREPKESARHRVLFIGNSLTYANDLPAMLAAVASAGGDTIVVASVTRPAYALIDHLVGSTRTDAIDRVRGAKWEYVVLQQGPTSRIIDRDTLVLAARMLDATIRAAGGRPALYMVWPALADSADFDRVHAAFQETACRVNGEFWPAGEAWRTAWRVDPTLRLYGSDDFHPSPIGTYLAALVMYERITGRDARMLPTRPALAGVRSATSEAMVRALHDAAHATNVAYPTACKG